MSEPFSIFGDFGPPGGEFVLYFRQIRLPAKGSIRKTSLKMATHAFHTEGAMQACQFPVIQRETKTRLGRSAAMT